MRNATARHWLKWRIAPAATPAPATRGGSRLRRMSTPISSGSGKDEQPGPDGIRHDLVARVRSEIAAGTYDTEEKWLAAEAELLRRIEERM